jgi:predicted enzyme related to lactoylglutathione lyase
MKVKALSWMGVKTSQFDDMVHLYRDVLQLHLELEQPDFAVFRLPNGDTLELFGPAGPNAHLAQGIVVCGFRVDDIEQARQDLIEAGIELIGPLQGDGGTSWQHFRGPGGSVFELNAELEHLHLEEEV